MDVVTGFYEQHPYPPPTSDLTSYREAWQDSQCRRVEHFRLWPSLRYREDHAILVAGCGTSQAAKYAVRYPRARVVGIDLSEPSLEHNRRLARQHGLSNLELRVLPLEQAAHLDESFDQVVCTGVLHHLACPEEGLEALAGILTPAGAIHLMVYGRYGRTGISIIQEYARLLGIRPAADEIADLIDTLRELPFGHPLSHLLRSTPDFQDPDALADALLHPRERSYTVPELFTEMARAGLRFGRWIRQAPYLPYCGSLHSLPHGSRIAALPVEEQYAAVELFRGTITRHAVVGYRADGPLPVAPIDFDGEDWPRLVPLRTPTAVSVEERLPAGAAAALLNRAHESSDLVLFVDKAQRAVFDAIDGQRSIGQIPGHSRQFFQQLWRHDLVVFDASDSGCRP